MGACVARIRGRWYKVSAAIRETTSPGGRGEAMWHLHPVADHRCIAQT